MTYHSLGPNLANKIGTTDDNFVSYIRNTKSEFAAFHSITIGSVYNLLSGLSSNKATGIDKISSKIIKIAAPVISDSLTHIFNQSIAQSFFPDEWKIARVVPLFKNGQRNLPENYRPIYGQYGHKPSTDMASFVMLKIAEENKKECPRAYTVLERDRYVDDLIHSCPNTEEAKETMHEVDRVLATGSFTIKEWLCSSTESNPDTSTVSLDG